MYVLGKTNMLTGNEAMFVRLLVWACLTVSCDTGVTFLLEAEQYVVDRMAYPRTTASGIWAVHFYQNEVFPVEFCLQSSTVIQVSGVRYSNDGEADYVEVKFDDERIGTFESHDMASSGDNWNRFENSGPIGHPMEVLPGKHRLELIFVSTDRHGIEIDYVALDVADELQDERMLQCRAYCDSSINYKPSLVFDTLPSGWLEQRSRHTECAEELNVKLELYHPALASYQITARPPSYRTLLNNQEQDFHNCGGSEKDEAVWFFNDFDVLTAGDQLRAGSGATLNFSGDDAASNTKLFVTFDTSSVSGQGPGAVLRLKFLRRAAEAGVVHVRLQANMTGRLLSEDRTVNPADSNREARWTLEASLLTEQPQAELVLTLVHNPSFPLRADYLRLVLQPQAEVVATVFKDRSTWVQTVANPRGGMLVHRPDSVATWHDVGAVRVLKKVAGAEDFEEVFRLSADGMLLLKHRAAYGSDSPPFGTSFVIGPSDPREASAAAPVTRIDVDPWALKFTLSYADATSVSDLLLRLGTFGSRVIVSLRRLAPAARRRPVAVVTSMWVADGKADVDHISANGAAPRDVLGGWGRLYGTSFAFFRQCVSRHNSQAPDIVLEFLEADHAALQQVDLASPS